jgi:hypothetical protein
MGSDKMKWEETEKFFQLITNNSSIHYTKQIDLVDYINAFNNLKFSVEKNMVLNLSSISIFFKYNGKTFNVLPGKSLNF